MDKDPSKKIEISLSSHEAIVLFELLTRFSNVGNLDIRDQAEQRVLWDILGVLESSLVEPLAFDYENILSQARANVRDK